MSGEIPSSDTKGPDLSRRGFVLNGLAAAGVIFAPKTSAAAEKSASHLRIIDEQTETKLKTIDGISIEPPSPGETYRIRINRTKWNLYIEQGGNWTANKMSVLGFDANTKKIGVLAGAGSVQITIANHTGPADRILLMDMGMEQAMSKASGK